jgi:DNA-binding NarL/FixJ family response regulator
LRRCEGLATGSSSGPDRRGELADALHRLRSTLARTRAELELALADGKAPPVGVLLDDVRAALDLLGAVEAAALGVVRVLVVDDDERLGQLTARGLRRLGYDADWAMAMRAPRPGEVVVFDLGVLRSLSSLHRDALRAARPIVVTGAVDGASRALAQDLQASDYLVKPVDVDALAAAINRRIAER